MNIRLSILAVLCFFSIITYTSQAQFENADIIMNRTTIGIKAGVNFPSFGYSDSKLSSYSQSIAPKGLFGLTSEFDFGNNLSSGLELLYVGRGTKIDDNGVNYQFNANYFDVRIPVTYSFKSFNGGFTPFISLVPNVGFATGGKITLDDYDVNVGSANLAPINFGIGLNVGAKIPIRISDFLCYLTAEAGYNLGLTNTYSSDELNNTSYALNVINYDLSGTTRTNRGVEVSLGFKIPLSNFTNKATERNPKIYEVYDTIRVNNDNKNKLKPLPPDKPCYTIDEVEDLIDNGIDVRGKKICVFDIKFDYNKATFKEDRESVKTINAISEMMKKYTVMHMVIIGHTDNNGTEEYNKDLSKRRAEAVQNYLIKKGIKKDRLSTKYFGQTKPIASNETLEGQAQNRRVEFEITFK